MWEVLVNNQTWWLHVNQIFARNHLPDEEHEEALELAKAGETRGGKHASGSEKLKQVRSKVPVPEAAAAFRLGLNAAHSVDKANWAAEPKPKKHFELRRNAEALTIPAPIKPTTANTKTTLLKLKAVGSGWKPVGVVDHCVELVAVIVMTPVDSLDYVFVCSVPSVLDLEWSPY